MKKFIGIRVAVVEGRDSQPRDFNARDIVQTGAADALADFTVDVADLTAHVAEFAAQIAAHVAQVGAEASRRPSHQIRRRRRQFLR